MKRSLMVLPLIALLSYPLTAEAKKGFYFGFNLGGAMISGESPVPFEAGQIAKDPDYRPNTDVAALMSTDVGSGFTAQFRMGYNILGFVAIETLFGGSGNGLGDGDTIEGQAGIYGLIRIFPAQLFKEVEDRWWDPYLFVGGGVHFIGYNPDAHAPDPMQNDGRAWWPGSAIYYGLGCDFYVAPFFSLGVDLAFNNAYHDTFNIDNDDDISATPIDTATQFAFMPTVKLTFHFGTD